MGGCLILLALALSCLGAVAGYRYAGPNILLGWKLGSTAKKPREEIIELKEGDCKVIAFDWFDDHADFQWEHRAYMKNGKIFVQQWTESYGHPARHGDGLFINGRKLGKAETIELHDGDVIYQLHRFPNREKPSILRLHIRPVPSIAVPQSSTVAVRAA